MPRQCASHCRCRLPGPASKRSSWQQSNVACRRRTPLKPRERGLQRGVRKGAVPLITACAGQQARSALARAEGRCQRSACSGSVLVCRRGWSCRLAQRAAAQPCGPAPGGGRVYRALHSPSGGKCPRIALAVALALQVRKHTARVRALLCPFSFFLLGRLEAAQAGACSV